MERDNWNDKLIEVADDLIDLVESSLVAGYTAHEGLKGAIVYKSLVLDGQQQVIKVSVDFLK